jgi:hypothetical protein
MICLELMIKTEWLRRPKYWLYAVVVVVFVIIMQRLNTKARTIESDLVAEFGKIEPQLHRTKVYEKRLHKPGVAYIRTQFFVEGGYGYEDIVRAYRTQLERNGWVFLERRDYPPNIEAIEFCKGPDAAALRFQLTSSPQTISFEMNWGLNDCSSLPKKK